MRQAARLPVCQRCGRRSRYEIIDAEAAGEPKQRVLRLLSNTDIPDVRDIVLISLADACGILQYLLSDREFRSAAVRINQIRNLDPVGQSVSKMLGAIGEPRRSVVLILRAAFLAAEFLACVLPQDDSPWRDFINRNLVGMFAHGGGSGGRYLEIYDRWFGRDSAVFYPLDQSSRDYLRNVSIWTY